LAAEGGSGRERRSSERPSIALVAYGCGPGEGSEPGTGWAWARLLATFADVTLITVDREPRVSRTISEIEALGLVDRIRFAPIPFPSWWPAPFHRFGRLNYLAWHAGMPTRVRQLGTRFDLAWHVTWANVWMGSAGYRLAPRFVLGPVGGGTPTPWRLAPALGPLGIFLEVSRTFARTAGRWLNPFGRATWTHAELILAQNPETVSWLPASARQRAVLFPNVVLDPPERHDDPPPGQHTVHHRGERRAIAVGRLLPLKGISLAIRALDYLPGWTLTIVGDGLDRRRLERLARNRGVRDRVEFTGWLERDDVQREMLAADVLLFPSLHDEGGWAVAEAVALGIPVVALDCGGPPLLGARVVAPMSPERTARAIATTAREEVARGRREPETAWLFERRRDALVTLLRERGILAG